MRSNNAFLTTSLFLSLTAGCGLIKVNGKPLGGGSSGSPSSGGDSSSSSSSATSSATDTSRPASVDKCEGKFGHDYHVCQEHLNDAANAELDAKRGKLPTWCREFHIGDTGDVDLEKFKNMNDPTRDIFDDAYAFADVMCSARGRNLEQRPKVMQIRTAWMKQHELDETDFAAAVSVKSRYVPDDQQLSALGPAVAQLELNDAEEIDKLGPRVSMLGRFGFVERCMSGDKNQPIRKIVCARDPLDLGKALAEIDAAPKILPHMRLRLRRRVRTVFAEQRALNAQLAEVAKSEPAVTKMIAIADAQFKEWANPTPARAKAVKLLEDMEAATAARKNSMFAGCEATTGAAWAEAVRAANLPAVSSEHTIAPLAPAVLSTTEAFLARRAFELCMEGTDHRSATPYAVIGPAAYRRGPRTGTVAAWFAASADLAFDSKDVTLADVLRGQSKGAYVNDDLAFVGTIASIEPGKSKGYVTISFKTDIAMREDCIDWKRTGRIANITAGGAVEYENVCTRRGMVKYDKSPDDISVDAILAAGLKPGMQLLMTRNSMRLADQPIVATANAKSSKAVWLFGVSLK